MKRSTWFIFFVFLAVSCLDDPDCFRLNNDVVGISFRVLGSSIPDTVRLQSITVAGKNLFTLSQPDTAITSLTLRLNYFQNETAITFTEPGIQRNLFLNYKVQSQFVSEDCGSRYILSDLRTTGHNFDTLRIANSSPGNKTGQTAVNNIDVFRCPEANMLTVALRQLTYNPVSNQKGSLFVGADLNGVDNNGTIYYADQRKTTLYLPLDPSAAAATFTFDFKDQFGSGLPRSLKVNYTALDEVRYPACGSQIFFSEIRVDADSDFDSASVVVESNVLRDRLTDPPVTNIQLYRCPDMNLVQIAFRKITSATTTQTELVKMVKITTDYSPDVFYENSEVSIIQLPLNPGANSTVFSFDYEDRADQTITLTYERSNLSVYEACGPQAIFRSLTKGGDDPNVVVLDNRNTIQFPPVTNIEIRN